MMFNIYMNTMVLDIMSEPFTPRVDELKAGIVRN